MTILGIDTATTNASVALVEAGQLIAEESHEKAKRYATHGSLQPKGNHAEILLPLIQSILDRSRVALVDLSGIALSIGPGSFTGLRIALATVKGMAYEWGLPVVGVSTLHANAARVTDSDGIICSLLDARKSEVYAALFRRQGTTLARLSDDAVISVHSAIDLIAQCAAPNVTIVGDGATAYEKLLRASLGAAIRISGGEGYGTLGTQVAALSWSRFAAGTTDDLGLLVPLYLRPSEAQTKPIRSILTC